MVCSQSIGAAVSQWFRRQICAQQAQLQIWITGGGRKGIRPKFRPFTGKTLNSDFFKFKLNYLIFTFWKRFVDRVWNWSWSRLQSMPREGSAAGSVVQYSPHWFVVFVLFNFYWTFYFLLFNVFASSSGIGELRGNRLTHVHLENGHINGSVKEPNISIYFFFFRPSLDGVLLLMFCLLMEGMSDFSVLKYY